MTPEQYSEIRQSLLSADHRLRRAQSLGASYWELHLQEAAMYVNSALIQLEYAKKAATKGDIRYGGSS